jgi:hypothetical protein
MKIVQFSFLAICLLASPAALTAQVPVRHIEGVTFGFLVMRNLQGEVVAHGTLKQVAKPGEPVLTDDLQFTFKDGSVYRDITKFTQRGTFRLVSDHTVQKGPAFKQAGESWIDARSGKVTVRTLGKDKDKETVKQMRLPPDVSNGLLFILVKNMDPSAETTVSMVAASEKPRVVKLVFHPSEEKRVHVGGYEFQAQHYIMKVKIEGVAGKVAPLVGKQPPDAHFWTLKSESPTFIEYEGPLAEDSPVWRIELESPEPDTGRGGADRESTDKKKPD